MRPSQNLGLEQQVAQDKPPGRPGVSPPSSSPFLVQQLSGPGETPTLLGEADTPGLGSRAATFQLYGPEQLA